LRIMDEKERMLQDLLSASRESTVNTKFEVGSPVIAWQERSVRMLVDIAFMDLSQPEAKAEMTRRIEHLRVLGNRIEEVRKATLPAVFDDPRVGSPVLHR